jgi:hypothetical protein
VVTRKTLIGLAAAIVLVAAACSGGDRPEFDEGTETEDTSSGEEAASSGDTTSTTAADSGEPTASPTAAEPTLTRIEPPPQPSPDFPPSPTAEDALAVYTIVSLDLDFVGDCANKLDSDPSPTLCYVTDNVTWTLGTLQTDPWYTVTVVQNEDGWVVTQVDLWTFNPPAPEGDPASEEGA